MENIFNICSRQTILVKMETGGSSELTYVPGDHVGVYPANQAELVDGVLARLHNAAPPDQIIRTEFLHEVTTPLGELAISFVLNQSDHIA